MSVSVPRKGVLIVRLLGQTVGRLDYSSHHNEMRFSYAPEYLANSNSMPLSRSLPLRSEPFDTETTTVFFENLLPPDQVRRKLGPILHISRHNIFGFLEALGGDCAGAISLCPENAMQDEESVARLEMLDEDAAVMVLRSLRKRPLYVNGVAGYRISGSGAQNKLIARIVDGRIALPLFGMPSTHIIKPPAEDYVDSVFNEFFSMSLAARIGLKTAKCGLMRIKGDPYYWTERYDRESVDGEIWRLHQEDFCQALGVSGEMKYESEGGPSFATCMKAMREMKFSLADRLAFIDRMIFNFLIGNADAHGKNSSILYRQKGGRVLAPVYDVMSTLVYPSLSGDGAMSIGGAKRFADVRRENFALMANEAEMRPALALGRLDAIASKILRHAEILAKELATDWPSDIYGRIVSVISSQLKQIRD